MKVVQLLYAMQEKKKKNTRLENAKCKNAKYWIQGSKITISISETDLGKKKSYV